MMSLDVLVAVNNRIARRAARSRLVPYVPSLEEIDHGRFDFPNLGYHVPEGWQKVESWFVDKFGVGRESEPAVTHRRLREILRGYITDNPGHGFGISEEGQFQMFVSAYRPVEQN